MGIMAEDKTIWGALRRLLPGCENLRGFTKDGSRRVKSLGRCFRVIKDDGTEATILWTDEGDIKEIKT